MQNITRYEPETALPYQKGSEENASSDIGRLFLANCLEPLNRKNRIADIGCGNGIDIQKYLSMGFENVAGIEPSETLRHEAVKLLKSRADILKGTFENLPFPNDSVDVVVSRFALHYCHDIKLALSEVARVLKPNGSLISIVSHPNADNLEARNSDDTITISLFNGTVPITFPVHTMNDYTGEHFQKYFNLVTTHEYCSSEQDRGANGLSNAFCFKGQRNYAPCSSPR